jgi:hypothetical protein
VSLMAKRFPKIKPEDANVDLDFSDIVKDAHEDNEPLSVWIPSEYKAKFNLLQGKTNKEFGKRLKEIIKQSIDKAIEINQISA